MSHELRTPLNNLLILAKMLAENGEGNLVPKQVKFAETIHSSGTDLLSLINDILDLSKIESGNMAVEASELRLNEVRDYVNRNFRHVADGKGLEFTVEVASDLPQSITTDVKRLQQVLKNLLSNALKFTERGKVALRVERAPSGWHTDHPILAAAESVIAFTVEDTGIGIPMDKQRIIFEAFQQADGTTSRKYGGTGLGLSISREIAHLLGGEIRLHSVPGAGSTFTLYLPKSYVAPVVHRVDGRQQAARAGAAAAESVIAAVRSKPSLLITADQEDDRENIQPGDQVLLVVDDDATYARIVLDRARERNYKVLVASRGDLGLAMARKFHPAAVLLDIGLPDTTGWAVLDQFEHDPSLRHIPVHVLSVYDDRKRGLALGATSYFKKAESREVLDDVFRRVQQVTENRTCEILAMHMDEAGRHGLDNLLDIDGVHLTYPASTVEAIDQFKTHRFDCVIIGMATSEIAIADLLLELQKMESDQHLEVLAYGTAGAAIPDLSSVPLREATILRTVKSPERLLNEVVRIAHVPETALPEYKRLKLERLRQVDQELAGSRVLIVDDDVRNIFALTSILERHQVEVLHAENGHTGIDMLLQTPGIDIVLMDIMMPGMDGYETIRAIRELDGFESLPIIAVTAKAMKGDREKCIASGASDYIAKPVDLDQLFSLMRVWIHDRRRLTSGAGITAC